MGSKERRERARSEIQKLILDAARELFVAEGYEAVTMRKIAEKIEYTPTAIYFYFRDKEALVRALCGEDFETLESRFRQIAARVRDPMECLRQMGLAYLEFGLSHPNHYRFLFMTPVLPPQTGRAPIDVVKEALSAAMASGRLRGDLTDVELVAQTLWSGLHGIIALHIVRADKGPNWRPAEAKARLMIDLLLRALVRS